MECPFCFAFGKIKNNHQCAACGVYVPPPQGRTQYKATIDYLLRLDEEESENQEQDLELYELDLAA